jgi:hypothetical protein
MRKMMALVRKDLTDDDMIWQGAPPHLRGQVGEVVTEVDTSILLSFPDDVDVRQWWLTRDALVLKPVCLFGASHDSIP